MLGFYGEAKQQKMENGSYELTRKQLKTKSPENKLQL